MKNIFYSIILLICSFGFANGQTDYCKDITKGSNPAGTHAIYTSPSTDFLTIETRISNSTSRKTTLFNLVTTKSTADYDAGGIYITFADGMMWKDEGKGIHCSYLDADHGYLYNASRILHDSEIVIFKTKKIVKVQITDVVIPVTDEFATKFMAYVNCIDAIKK